MSAQHWYLLIGALLILVALAGRRVARWPLTTAMIYLALGYALGHFGVLDIALPDDAGALEIASEIAVVLSLFSVGLRLRGSPETGYWRLPIALATLSMTATVALVAAAGVWIADLPLGAAVILGAIVAPTDPVLAGDVQVEDADDHDPVRRTLTGEAGLNDGTAFPFLLLGLGLLAEPDLSLFLPQWLGVDVLWKAFGGLAIGAALGALTARLVTFLQQRHGDALGYDDFLALGLIALTYGCAHALHTYGFLAVFAAGWALHTGESSERGAAPLSKSMLRFNDHMDRIAELALVLVTGALAATLEITAAGVLFALLTILLLRPLAVAPVCVLHGLDPRRTALVAWFGVRGIGSIYYLAYAVENGLPAQHVEPLTTLVLSLILVSCIAHGATGTPGMRKWNRRRGSRAHLEAPRPPNAGTT